MSSDRLLYCSRILLDSLCGVCTIAKANCTWMNETGKVELSKLCLQESLFGFLRLVLIAYGVCSFMLGWVIVFLTQKHIPGTISCFCHSSHNAGPLKSIQSQMLLCGHCLIR